MAWQVFADWHGACILNELGLPEYGGRANTHRDWRKGMRWKRGTRTGMWALLAGVLVIGSGAGCNHVNRDELATDLDGVRSELRAEQQESAD